jgi:four helix bundle protein
LKDFKTRKVWRQAHELVQQVYRVTTAFPAAERYGLMSQMRRAGVSIPANIAEGCGRAGDAELARFLQIAMGSASELEYHLLLTRDLEYLSGSDHERLTGQVVEV